MTARRAALAVAVVLAAFTGVLVIGLLGREDDTAAMAPSPLDGELAPALVGPTIDGSTYDLDRDRGAWVIVNFFATWCPPCVREHPELVEFAERHGDGDRRVLSVVFGGPGEAAATRTFFDRNGGDWPVLLDDGGRAAVDYGVTKVPESILVAPSGVVVGKIRGGVTADGLDALIDALLAGVGS
ncbi:MAG: TlpA family protein disulfide reductase [Actinobacteria bacterium]|nr:TlpA family protein disulfide reductase [Actinomycetota bacterium]